MKGIIISFILFVLYDQYMRGRNKAKCEQGGKAPVTGFLKAADLDGIEARLRALEQSAFA